MKTIRSSCAALLLTFVTLLTFAQEQPKPVATDAAEVAKKLANPVASMISVPFQNSMEVGIGDYNGSRNTLNIQPVIPIKLSSSLNLITRVILPIVTQHDLYGENTQQGGLGDAVVSAFFSPAEAKNGAVWGAGPVLLVPTATDELLGTKKFGVGPTALILKQANGWTYGALVNQVWSTGGDEDRANVDQMYVNPFLAYNWKSGAGLGLQSDIYQDWEGSTTTAFIIAQVSGVTRLGNQIVSLIIGPRLQVAGADGSKSDFGVRAQVTLVFPK